MSETPPPLVIGAALDRFPRLLAWAEDAAAKLGLSPSTAFALQLCLEEAFTNIVRHAFADRSADAAANEDVGVTIRQEEGAIVLTIEDRGIAFDPLSVPGPEAHTSIEDITIGGYGITLMRKFAERIAYERGEGVNRLSLRFTI